MTTSYPAGLDSYTNPTATDELDDEIGTRTHSEFHADNNDAIEAIQAKLGTTTTPATFSVGSAAAPALTFTGDTNTGVFQSAADAVGISAGGTERLTVGTSAATFTVPASWTQANNVETRSMSVQAYGTGKGPFVASVLNVDHAGTVNPALAFGYNQTAGGARILANEPALTWHIEADYNDSSGDNKMEIYPQFLSGTTATALRPLFFQFNRDTDALSNATIMGTATGGLNITSDDGSVQGLTVAQFIKNSHEFVGQSGGNNVLTVSGASSQFGRVQVGYSGDDDVFQMTAASGTTGTLGINGTTVLSAIATQVSFPVTAAFSVPSSYPVGAVGAPSLFFDGDSGTGIYQPSFGAVGVTTAGVQRTQVDSTGLTVMESAAGLADCLIIRNTNTTGTSSVGMIFQGNTSVAGNTYPLATINAVKEGVFTNGDGATYDAGLRISTVNNAGMVEAVSIASSGMTTFNQGITLADGMNIVANTTTGTKIGTATTQKIGFYNATPVVKPTGVAVDAAGIHGALVTLGLIA